MRFKAGVFKVLASPTTGDINLKLWIGLRRRRVQGSGSASRLEVAQCAPQSQGGGSVPELAQALSPDT